MSTPREWFKLSRADDPPPYPPAGELVILDECEGVSDEVFDALSNTGTGRRVVVLGAPTTRQGGAT